MIELHVEMILRCFQRITDRNVERMGFNPKFSRPDWMICTVLAVPPLTVRPSVVMDDKQTMEDDLTHVLISIVRQNKRLRDLIDKGESAEVINNATSLLQYFVATYVDNNIKGLAPAAQRSGRPLRTLKARMGAKTGRVRGNLMGKRVDFSARSVITPDPNIDVDELGVPQEIAQNLTFPEIVTIYNRDRLMMNVRNGVSKYPGAKSVVLKNDSRSLSLRFNTEMIDLNPGDVVNRHLINGDVVLFNRQPSLHKASMECHRVRVLPVSTFRLNVSATKPYNADFDGDEMNMHVPQSIAAATEIKYLASVLRQIISPRTTSPIIAIFQDTLTGAYRLTQDSTTIPEHIAMNMLARTKRLLGSYKRKDTTYSGKELVSSSLPLMSMNKSVHIVNGSLVKGVIKSGSSKDIVHHIYNEFGPKRAGQYINDVQNIVTKFNMFYGFSVGTSDLILSVEMNDKLQDIFQKGRKSIAAIVSSVHAGTFTNTSGRSDGEELEDKILTVIKTEVNSKIGEETKASMSSSNRMRQMVDSGSKGADHNITQMASLVGQQEISGRRIQYGMNHRTLPHFHKFDDGAESRGFVENSFIAGIRPAEFFFHAMGGREGIIDTAVKTADSGYIQRKLVKTMEDIHVAYDGTVRNVNGAIVQYRYGGDGTDSICVEKVEMSLPLMSLEDIYREFALSKEDLPSVVKGDLEKIPDLVDEILQDRDELMKNVIRYQKNDSVKLPVNFNRIVEKYRNPYSVKTDLTPEYVVSELNKIFANSWIKYNKLMQIAMRFFFAPKKVIIDMRLSKDMFDEMLKEVHFRSIKAAVHPGEMVGTLGAQSIGEPTTQLTLNTFHNAGSAKANATAGVPRIRELLEVTKNPKTPMNIVYLDNSISSSTDETMKKRSSMQKTTLRDITKSVRIYYDSDYLLGSTSVADDREILEAYAKFSVAHPQSGCASPWIIRLELDRMEMAARSSVVDMAMIASKINGNKILKVFECIPSNINSPDKLIMRISFPKDVVKNALSLRFIEDKLLDTVLSGIEGAGRVYARRIESELLYDEMVGGYRAVGQWVLDVEGTNLLELAMVPGVDSTRFFSNDIHEILDIFGIEAARIALFDEFTLVFKDTPIDYHHMMILVDSMTYPGFVLKVDRNGMSKNTENGVLAKSSFEETAKHLFNAAILGEVDNMKGISANIMFGQKPPCGTGLVEILVDETKFPDGDDESHPPIEEQLDEVNKLIESMEDNEDLSMMTFN
jgi:DNA-directed RNA polymerase II subunit RPB1